jgi:DNA-directed RNA polymerase subunit F
MQVINDNSAVLSNYEVFSLLQDIQSGSNGQRKPGNGQQQLATITYETVKYLESTPAAQQSPEVIERFSTALKPFGLTKAEHLQLLNHRPTSDIEIQLLVEESEERLSEEELYQLIEVVKETLPAKPDDSSDEPMQATEQDS